MLLSSIRTWESKVQVTGYLEGTIKDWPAQIQDGIYAAMEVKSQEVELPLALVHSSCECMYNDEGKVDGYFIYIVLSEIVARDMRFSSDEQMKKHFKDFIEAQGGTIQ